MRIPSSLLRTRAVITTETGTAGNGTPVLGRPRACRGKLERKRRRVTTAMGTNVTGSASFLVRPDVDVAVGDRVDIGLLTYDVLEITVGDHLGRDAFQDLTLAGPR